MLGQTRDPKGLNQKNTLISEGSVIAMIVKKVVVLTKNNISD